MNGNKFHLKSKLNLNFSSVYSAVSSFFSFALNIVKSNDCIITDEWDTSWNQSKGYFVSCNLFFLALQKSEIVGSSFQFTVGLQNVDHRTVNCKKILEKRNYEKQLDLDLCVEIHCTLTCPLIPSLVM